MLEVYGNTSNGEDYNILFKEFGNKVINDHKAVFDKEDVNGWDCGHVSATVWYMVFLWAVLLKTDYLSGFYSIADLRQRYKIDELRRCLECRKIPLFYVLELIGIDIKPPTVIGIETMKVEDSFIVEKAKCLSPVEDNTANLIGTTEGIALFQSLWASESNCEILLNSNC